MCFYVPALISGLTSSPYPLTCLPSACSTLHTVALHCSLSTSGPLLTPGSLYGQRLLVEHSSIRYSMGELSEAPSSQWKFQGTIPGVLFLLKV